MLVGSYKMTQARKSQTHTNKQTRALKMMVMIVIGGRQAMLSRMFPWGKMRRGEFERGGSWPAANSIWRPGVLFVEHDS